MISDFLAQFDFVFDSLFKKFWLLYTNSHLGEKSAFFNVTYKTQVSITGNKKLNGYLIELFSNFSENLLHFIEDGNFHVLSEILKILY